MQPIAKILFVTLILISRANGSVDAISQEIKMLDGPRIISKADLYLKESPQTVTVFICARSPGGPHDFYSEGDYWWPDAKNPNGPYVQRDGMTNPDNFVDHRHAMIHMSMQVGTLVSAYRVSGNAKYAKHAIEHLHAWFVDDKTRMNRNLKFAQAVKGVATGRSIGIIDTIHLIEVARSVTILEQAGVLKGNELAAIKLWFTDYLKWLTTDKAGIQEMNAANNHGTCWVMQVAQFAATVGDLDRLALCRRRFKEVLLPNQMAADGSFPQELHRTKPYGYSLFNLDAMATLCQIASKPEDNLWTYSTPDGRNMQKGVEFMYPYVKDKSSWLVDHKPDVMFFEFWPVRSPAFLFSGMAFPESKYFGLWKTLKADPSNEEVLRNLPIRHPILWINQEPT